MHSATTPLQENVSSPHPLGSNTIVSRQKFRLSSRSLVSSRMQLKCCSKVLCSVCNLTGSLLTFTKNIDTNIHNVYVYSWVYSLTLLILSLEAITNWVAWFAWLLVWQILVTLCTKLEHDIDIVYCVWWANTLGITHISSLLAACRAELCRGWCENCPPISITQHRRIWGGWGLGSLVAPDS